MQALRCVEYRIPSSSTLKREGNAAFLGLRYGLIGAAAAHHLLVSATDDEELSLNSCLRHWAPMVSDHLRWEVGQRVLQNRDEDIAALVGALAKEPIDIFVALHRRMCPLDMSLSVACDDYCQRHDQDIIAGWSWLQRRKARREFGRLAEQSYDFALMFFERRQAGLEELPEIALLGE